VHTTADGRRLWVTHGDYFDGVIQCAKWLAFLGDNLYEFTLKLNRYLNTLRARMGLPYWSLSAYLKHKVKSALNYVTDFEVAVAHAARVQGHDGVVCGHIHRAEMRDIQGTLYCNDGDWVESRSALVEHHDGRLELVYWNEAESVAVGVETRQAGIGMKLVLVTDAWQPQVNGVVTTLVELVREMQAMGHQVEVIHPGLFDTRPCPGYAGIDLAVRPAKSLARRLDAIAPDAIHLATEGPLGWAARAYCTKRGLAFTTAYHTRFPEILKAALHIPLWMGYALFRHFHKHSSGVLVPTHSVLKMLQAKVFAICAAGPMVWTCNCSSIARCHSPYALLGQLARPLSLFVGRVSYEKNIEAFLKLDILGTKVVCGVDPWKLVCASGIPMRIGLACSHAMCWPRCMQQPMSLSCPVARKHLGW
jgi:hypothetical protein